MIRRHAPSELLCLAAAAVLVSGCSGGATTMKATKPPAQDQHAEAAGEQAEPPPPSCEPPDPPEGVTKLQVRRGEVQDIEYLEVVYGDAEMNDRLPMVVGIHGLGDEPRLPEPEHSDFGEAYRIIQPRGPIEHGAGYAWFDMRVGDDRPNELAEALAEQADRVASAIEELRGRLPTRGAPVIAGGSQGGMMTFALAIRHPQLVGGAVALMGWLPPPLVPDALEEGASYPRIRSAHGVEDDIVPLAPTREMIARLAELGVDVELRTYEGLGHEMSPAMERDVKDWLEAMVKDQLRPDGSG